MLKSQDTQLSPGQVTMQTWPDGAQRFTVHGWAVRVTVHPESLGAHMTEAEARARANREWLIQTGRGVM